MKRSDKVTHSGCTMWKVSADMHMLTGSEESWLSLALLLLWEDIESLEWYTYGKELRC